MGAGRKVGGGNGRWPVGQEGVQHEFRVTALTAGGEEGSEFTGLAPIAQSVDGDAQAGCRLGNGEKFLGRMFTHYLGF